MITFPRTTTPDFTVDGTAQLLGGDQSRVMIIFTNPSGSQVGIDYIQQTTIADCAFIVNGFDSFVMTKGDFGSILGAPLFGTTGPPNPLTLWVTEILLVS